MLVNTVVASRTLTPVASAVPVLPLGKPELKKAIKAHLDQEKALLSAKNKPAYSYDAELLIEQCSVDYAGFIAAYQESGIDVLLAAAAGSNRSLQILTVDVLGLSKNTSADVYARIAFNFNELMKDLGENGQSVWPKIQELLAAFSLPFHIEEDRLVFSL